MHSCPLIPSHWGKESYFPSCLDWRKRKKEKQLNIVGAVDHEGRWGASLGIRARKGESVIWRVVGSIAAAATVSPKPFSGGGGHFCRVPICYTEPTEGPRRIVQIAAHMRRRHGGGRTHTEAPDWTVLTGRQRERERRRRRGEERRTFLKSSSVLRQLATADNHKNHRST